MFGNPPPAHPHTPPRGFAPLRAPPRRPPAPAGRRPPRPPRPPPGGARSPAAPARAKSPPPPPPPPRPPATSAPMAGGRTVPSAAHNIGTAGTKRRKSALGSAHTTESPITTPAPEARPSTAT